MKIIGIVCSPRKEGNTELMMLDGLAAAKEAASLHKTEIETSLILAADKTIAPCDHCGVCAKTGVCHIKDDMQALYQELENANGIIFGTPVYFHNVTAQAKAIMDRTYAFLFEKKLKGKVAGPIVVTRRVGAAQTRNLLYGYFLAHKMIPVPAGIGYGREKGEVKENVGGGIGTTALEEARNVGKDVVDMVVQLSK